MLQKAWAHNPRERPAFQELIERIDELLVSAATKDVTAQKFWDTFWVRERDPRTAKEAKVLLKVVPWRDLVPHFARTLKLERRLLEDQIPREPSRAKLTVHSTDSELEVASASQLSQLREVSESQARRVNKEFNRRQLLLKVNCLKSFLTNDEDQVTLERFGKIMDIFGPLDDQLLDKVSFGVFPHSRCSLLCQRNGFMVNSFLSRKSNSKGDMSSHEAYELLADKPLGHFLVRFSATTNAFTITVVVKAKEGSGRSVIHIRVKHTPGEGFSIPAVPATSTLQDLLRIDPRFTVPQPPPSSKFDFLTSLPVNHSEGYQYVIGW